MARPSSPKPEHTSPHLSACVAPRRPRRRGTSAQHTRAGAIGVNLAMAVVAIACVIPVLWMVLIALRPVSARVSGLSVLSDPQFTLANFPAVAQAMPLWTSIANSLFTTSVGTITTLFFCSLAGYAFSKFRFRGREVLFYALLATMLLPEEIGVIPLFVIMRDLGLVNSLWSLIIPRAATAVGIFYMRQYIDTVPDELLEAARIDGCNSFSIYWRIILPVIQPALAVWASLTIIARWNDFFWPLVFLRSESKHTLMLSLSLLPVSEGLSTPWPVIMAGTAIAVVPMVVGYLIFQRFQQADLTEGAVKA